MQLPTHGSCCLWLNRPCTVVLLLSRLRPIAVLHKDIGVGHLDEVIRQTSLAANQVTPSKVFSRLVLL